MNGSRIVKALLLAVIPAVLCLGSTGCWWHHDHDHDDHWDHGDHGDHDHFDGDHDHDHDH